MAKHLVNEDIEFFYCETFSFDLLLKELNNKFSYQKVGFISFEENFKQKLENAKEILFFPEFLETSVNQIDTDVACLVCNGESDFKNCNKICKDLSLSLVLYIDEYFNLSNLCLDGDARLLGIVIDKTIIEKNSKMFVLNFLFNLSQMVFFSIECKINNIYFNKPLSEKIKKINEKIENFINLLQKNTVFYDFDEVMDCYSELITLFINEKESVLNYISHKVKGNNFDTFLLSQIILNIYLCFSQNINPNLVDYPNLSVDDYNNTANFLVFNKKFNDQKFWFVYDRFNLSVQNIINNGLLIIEKIKDLCNQICVDEMFNLTANTKIVNIKKVLCNVVMQYPNESYLKVICNYGLLNFENNK